jgi:chromosome segregation ATPase
MRVLAALVGLALASCQPPAAATRDVADTADANARQALSQLEEMRAEIDKRGTEIETLKAQSAMYENRLDTLEEQHEELRKKHNLLNDTFTKYQIENEHRLAETERRLGIR